MIRKTAFTILAALAAVGLHAKDDAVTVNLRPDPEAPVIPKEIYGQFAEHLGSCIYGGIWVGPDSPIPNTDGYRNDVLEAFRELHIPVIRWPGGCFADEYHWMDGIGPRHQRPRMVNNNWGGTVEDNSFGTHEFFNLCEMLGCEPYLSGNVGSGTVEELAKWVEYITAADGPMARLRAENGRPEPWHLKYLGVGNESWGCGGNFTAEFYSNVYRRYQTYCRDYNGNHLYKIASGASDYDYDWTETMMRNARQYMDGISLHYYTVTGWTGSKGSATEFAADDYYWTLGKCLEIEPVIRRHCDIMDKYDPERRVGLLVDEWGTWWDQEPGSIPGHLYQQNTMRDAMVAALSLNIFHNCAPRVRMANIAQIANVLQSMVLTRDDKMVLTPTYYVFKMYAPHQDATLVPLDVDCRHRRVPGDRSVPYVSATASVKDGTLTVTLANTSLDAAQDVRIPLGAFPGAGRGGVSGQVLSGDSVDAYNDFGQSERVTLKPFDGARIKGGVLTLTLPPASVVSLSL